MMNEKYSLKDFTDQSFKDEPVVDFNNTTIKGSNFYQQYFVDNDIFPDGMTGVTFENCNLDNVMIPPGNIVTGGCNRNIRVQNDGNDWVLDGNLNPIEPVHKKRFIRDSISIDPVDIPAKYILAKRMSQEDYDIAFEGNKPQKGSFFKSVPDIVGTAVKESKTRLHLEGECWAFKDKDGGMH